MEKSHERAPETFADYLDRVTSKARKELNEQLNPKIEEKTNMKFFTENWKWIVGTVVLLTVFNLLNAANFNDPIYNPPQPVPPSPNYGTVSLAPTIVNISNWTHGSINDNAFYSGWGLPIPQHLSITREDQVIHGLLHTNTWDYGFNQSYTFNQIGAQTTYEVGTNPTFGMSSSGAITRPLQVNGW